MDYEYFMTKALQQAETALAAGEFPVGCVMVHIESFLRESGKYLLKGQSFGQLYTSPINNRLKSLVPFANGVMPDKTGFLIAFFSCIS